jgi:anti-sigma factor RsiW
MKQEKFIELLNLYVDGALAPDAAAELEREITSDPARHKIYRQYCQMQRACTVLAERFRDDAAPAVHFRRGRVVRAELPRRTGWLRPVAWAASGAAAACFVFLAVRSQIPAGQSTVAAAMAPAPVLAVSGPGALAPAVTTPVVARQPVFFRDPWRSNSSVPMRMVGWRQLPLAEQPFTLVVPPLTEFRDLNDPLAAPSLQPTMRMEEVQSAAFQYQQ